MRSEKEMPSDADVMAPCSDRLNLANLADSWSTKRIGGPGISGLFGLARFTLARR